jgi:RNA polymerase sigma-70 factor (ECF subfamily)
MTAAEPPGGIEARLHTEGTRPAAAPGPARAAEPDARALARMRGRDLQAFETLYRDHAGRVYGLCLRLAGDAARAEDLVQEVFLRVWQKIDTFEGRSRFSTWLYRLAVNRVTDVLRLELRRSLLQAPEDAAWEVPQTSGAGSRPDARLDLEDAIRELPAGARLVFVLHDVEGYGHEEIAAMAGIAVGTSKSQLYRARRLLRERLSR